MRTDREELLRAGLFGVHEVVVVSLNKVLETELPEGDEEFRQRFTTYCQAVKSFLLLHLQNQATIFGHLRECFGLDQFLAERPSDDELRALLARVDELEDAETTVSHIDVFRPIADELLPEVARIEAFFEGVDLTSMPKAVEKAITRDVEKANRSDPNASLTVPLLFWTLSDKNYDLMIRKSVPWPVRCLLCSYLFWAKAKHIVEFVPHYRSNWAL
jgi:hypothetical protein